MSRGHTADRTLPVRLVGLAGFVAAVAVAAVVGSVGAAGSAETYAALDLPMWAPPSGVFGPVWTVLYVMIAIAGWLVWRSAGWHASLWAYAVQLFLNALWPVVFFGAAAYGLAVLEIILLWLAIGVTVVGFWPVHRLAASLLLPYWAWTTYAGALTIAVWILN